MSDRRRPRPTDDQIVAGLLDAYRAGAFPMADPRTGRIEFYSPDPRGVLPLTGAEGFHVSTRLARRMRAGGGPFRITFDRAFGRVMRGCMLPRKRRPDHDADEDTWINDTILHWYALLHARGHAHSAEAWAADPARGEEVLVGGIYGVSIGAAFFGESMFCLPRARRADGSRDPLDGTDASKVCLVMLVRRLHALGYRLFDTQMVTDHVARFGGKEIPREEYLLRLAGAVSEPDRWSSEPRP